MPALQAVANVVDRRQSMQILGNVLLNAQPSGLNLTATDMEVEVSLGCGAEVLREGSTTLPAKKLLDICRSLPSDSSLQIDVTGGKAKVQSGRSRFSLGVLPADDFPAVGSFQHQVEIKIRAAELSELVRSTQFAMAHQDVRYYLNGLLLEMRGQTIRAVATDGHRLALCDRQTDQDLGATTQIIVPRKAVQEIQRMLAHQDGEVTLVLGENHLRLEAAGQSLTAKLIDGKFPDYQRVIPVKGEKSVIADREALRSAFSRTSILSNEKFRGVRLVLGTNLLKAMTHNPEQEEAEEDLEVTYTGADLEIGFNVSYLLDVLTVLESKGSERDEVCIELSDPNSSAVIFSPDDQRARYVIMPMRL